MSEYDEEEEMAEESGTNIGVIYFLKAILIIMYKIIPDRSMKVTETKSQKDMVMVKPNYPIMIYMKVTIKMAKDMGMALISKLSHNIFIFYLI